MRQRIVNSVFSVLVLCSSSVWAAQKVVFVVGNSQYQAAKLLSNPVNDAIDIEAKFKQLGYTTIILKNATRKEMLAGLQRFRKELQGSEVGVFYYAGHGVELDRYNYLVPVDAAMNDPMEVKYETLALDDVAKVLNESGVKSGFIVLDACRDNPFKAASRSGSRGLQHMSKDTVGELKIIYAAQEGQVANDGNDRNGVFTSQFLRYLDEPNLSYPFFFDKVKQGVVQKSGGKQRPTEQGEISPSFSFVPAVVETVKPVPVVNQTADAEITFWNSIASSTDASDYVEYLKAYPNGKFAGLAQNRKDRYAVKPTIVSSSQLEQLSQEPKSEPNSIYDSLKLAFGAGKSESKKSTPVIDILEKNLRSSLEGKNLEMHIWKKGYLELRFQARMAFPAAQTDIKQEFFDTLDLIAEQLKARSDFLINISGHTDNVGRDDINVELSSNRALAVGNYLRQKGVTSQIITKGFGKSQPAYDNVNEEGRIRNRRIEIEVSMRK
ncbi:MAG: caspase family protein [Pseudomonadales bacterium]|nr:caspase family protein [Pseudomonadales bacterium]